MCLQAPEGDEKWFCALHPEPAQHSCGADQVSSAPDLNCLRPSRGTNQEKRALDLQCMPSCGSRPCNMRARPAFHAHPGCLHLYGRTNPCHQAEPVGKCTRHVVMRGFTAQAEGQRGQAVKLIRDVCMITLGAVPLQAAPADQRFGECDGFFRADASAAEGPAGGPPGPAAVAHFRRLLARHPAMAARHSAARLLTKQAPEALLRGIVVRKPWMDPGTGAQPSHMGGRPA